MEGFLYQATIYLVAAVVAVPIAARLGFGSVLGYLAAGIIIGPVLGWVGSETATLQHVAEFGVVMMLFLIGLELEPRALWDMRHRLLGLGGLQIVLTTMLLTAAIIALGENWQTALALGLALSLSSTAIVLQTLSEKGLSLVDGLPAGASRWSPSARRRGDPRRHLPDRSGLPLHPPQPPARDVYRRGAVIVVGIAFLMILVGLSPALGAFVAGVVLANSEFRTSSRPISNPSRACFSACSSSPWAPGSTSARFSPARSILGLTLGLMAAEGRDPLRHRARVPAPGARQVAVHPVAGAGR
jgi:CPA2 family monovalent cation:H+ antiporter-2